MRNAGSPARRRSLTWFVRVAHARGSGSSRDTTSACLAALAERLPVGALVRLLRRVALDEIRPAQLLAAALDTPETAAARRVPPHAVARPEREVLALRQVRQ